MTQYKPMEVLTSVKEPYSKDTLWIHPLDQGFEIKIFNKGWETILNTNDLGLSEISEQQVKELVKSSENVFNFKLNKIQGQHRNSMLNIMNKNKELEQRIIDLENKLDRLTKRYSTLLVK